MAGLSIRPDLGVRCQGRRYPHVRAAIVTTVDLSFSLDGKVAVITGGASGIGAAIAAGDAAKGAKVVILDLTVPSEPGHVAAFACDVTDQASVVAAVDQVMPLHSRIDVLVNSAGVV